MLVVIKAILYERTVSVCASMDFGKGWEDLRWQPGGGRRLWRQVKSHSQKILEFFVWKQHFYS